MLSRDCVKYITCLTSELFIDFTFDKLPCSIYYMMIIVRLLLENKFT